MVQGNVVRQELWKVTRTRDGATWVASTPDVLDIESQAIDANPWDQAATSMGWTGCSFALDDEFLDVELLREPDGESAPDLSTYDVILVNSSAGKDSQASLDVTVSAAAAAGVKDRLVVVHADLGDNEWEGVAELAAEHAAHYGLRFEIARRTTEFGEVDTILSRVLERGMWPDAARRWCTSDHKRGPIRKTMTRLVQERRETGTVRPVRLLNVMGLRAEESSALRRRSPYSANGPASNGRRHVDDWYPIHAWSTREVWERIDAAGTRPHPAYAAGVVPILRSRLTGGPHLLSQAQSRDGTALRRC